MRPTAPRCLVAGWFSFEEVVATVGDLRARDVACEWLEAAGLPYDVACAPFMAGGVDWRAVDPERYSHLMFVCGPFGDRPLINRLLDRFRHCRLLGLNLTVLDPSAAGAFDLLLERDGIGARPDLSFAAPPARVPVAGLALAPAQLEYPDTLHARANEALERLPATRGLAVVDVDTDLLIAGDRFRTPAQVESLIARTDIVLTSRLHGMVLALKSGVPAVAVDPIPGGAKVRRQAETIGWPVVFTADEVDDRALEAALDRCLGEEARDLARRCRERALASLEVLRAEFVAGVRELDGPRPGAAGPVAAGGPRRTDGIAAAPPSS